MTINEAIREWGYSPKDAERLEKICRSAKKRFVKKGEVCIPDDCAPLYLLDRRLRAEGAVYAQLLNACVLRREVVPQSLRLEESEMFACLEQLVAAGMLFLHDKKRPANLRYLPTPTGEEYNYAKNRVKRLLEAVKPIIPSAQITVNAGA